MKVIDNLLPNDTFSKLSSCIMQHNGYKCFDYTVHPKESDGSINYFGEKDLQESKKHEVLFTLDIYKKGYSVIDIFDTYFNFIKLNSKINEELKYKIMQKVAKSLERKSK